VIVQTSPELRRLSVWLAPLRRILAGHGYRHFYIGGSSAREILDHVFLATPIVLRDLDVYLLKNGTAGPDDVARLCADIRREGLAEIGPLREKRRANPALVGRARYEYLAGYGVHLTAPERPILSLGVLHGPGDLALNGLFSFDTIFLATTTAGPFLHRAELIDPHDGYLAWRTRSPRIVHWHEVERCFARHAFRIVRSLAKSSSLRVPEHLAREYRRRRPAVVTVDDPVELRRDFLKVLGDEHWADELVMLASLEALTPVSPRLQAAVATTTAAELRRAVPARPGGSPGERALLRAGALCDDLSLAETAGSVYGASRCA